MTPIAENSFTLTEALFREGMERVTRDSYGKFAKRAALVLLGAWVLLTAFSLWRGSGLVMPAVELVVLGLVVFWMLVLLPRRKTRKAFRALQARSGPELTRVTRFYQDRLKVTAGDREMEVPYEDVTELVNSEHLLILLSASKTGIMLERSSYTRGDEETVRSLLRPEAGEPAQA